MSQLTVEDIRNPSRVSGFDHVSDAAGPSERSSGRPRWRAQRGGWKAGVPFKGWRGPTRPTPELAAQDYIDYVNSGTAPPSVALKTANHPSPPPRAEMSDEERKLRKRLRKIEAEKNKGRTGYVYLIATKGDAYAVKVGHSYDAPSRPKSLQTGNPRVLVVVSSFAGNEAREKELHAKYIRDNILGEWFRPSVQLLSEFGVAWSDYLKAVWT